MTEETSNISSVSVCIEEHPSTERVIECLDGMQTRTFPKDPETFNICGRFNNEIADALRRAFESFVTRKIQWRRLNLYVRRDSEIEPQHLANAMGVANRGSLFEIIDIQTLGLEGEEHEADPLPTNVQVLSSLETNHRLESLHLSRFVLSQEDTVSLGNALRTSTKLHTFTFACATTEPANQGLGDALASNSTLRVAFIYERNEVASQLMRALVDHPSLEDLRVISKMNSDLPVVLSAILSAPTCCLKTLAVFMDNASTRRNVAPLLEGIAKNKSLTFLASWFHFPGDRPLTNFLQIWKSHPTLKRVQFWERFTTADIQQATRATKFTRRVDINYVEPEGSKRPRDDNYEVAVKDLLDKHPEICWTNDDLYSEGAPYASCLNHSGRYLIHRQIPQGLWPCVLERIQKSSFRADRELCGELSFPDHHKASAVYELLHGQAFAGRSDANVSKKSGKKRRWKDISGE